MAAKKLNAKNIVSLNKLTDGAIGKIQSRNAALLATFGEKFDPEVTLSESALILSNTPHDVLAGVAAVALHRLSTFANSEALSPELAALDFIPGDGEEKVDGN